jgi:hypothetical protein
MSFTTAHSADRAPFLGRRRWRSRRSTLGLVGVRSAPPHLSSLFAPEATGISPSWTVRVFALAFRWSPVSWNEGSVGLTH